MFMHPQEQKIISSCKVPNKKEPPAHCRGRYSKKIPGQAGDDINGAGL